MRVGSPSLCLLGDFRVCRGQKAGQESRAKSRPPPATTVKVSERRSGSKSATGTFFPAALLISQRTFIRVTSSGMPCVVGSFGQSRMEVGVIALGHVDCSGSHGDTSACRFRSAKAPITILDNVLLFILAVFSVGVDVL